MKNYLRPVFYTTLLLSLAAPVFGAKNPSPANMGKLYDAAWSVPLGLANEERPFSASERELGPCNIRTINFVENGKRLEVKASDCGSGDKDKSLHVEGSLPATCGGEETKFGGYVSGGSNGKSENPADKAASCLTDLLK